MDEQRKKEILSLYRFVVDSHRRWYFYPIDWDEPHRYDLRTYSTLEQAQIAALHDWCQLTLDFDSL